MMQRKLLFIVNPNAGKKHSGIILETIKKEFPENICYEIIIWKNKDHFNDILNVLHSQKFTDAIAVGGDGTVNQVAKSLLGTEIRLGIIPCGSGNGLARSLGLSMNIEEAIKQIAEGKNTKIDTGTVNGIPFFCTSGTGFDAHIGHLFATSLKRGLQSYIKITIRELLNYRSKEYSLELNGTVLKRKAFLITAANAGQYGNNFYIAPEAKMKDGKFHVVILKPFGVLGVLGLLIKILRMKANESSYIETHITDKLTIIRPDKSSIHFDGEPEMQNEKIEFNCHPASLNVIIGSSFKEA